MKKTNLFSSCLLSLCFLLVFTACTDEDGFNIDYIGQDEFVPEEVEVDPGYSSIFTLPPDIDASTVVFNGKIGELENVGPVRYGFMWYATEGNEFIDPIRVDVGKTETPEFDFSAEMQDLPIGIGLVVCAFIESDDSYDFYIGEELPFTIDK